MPCKLAVIRRPSGLFQVGDVIEAFDLDIYLGDAVEPVGGAYVLVEVTNADKDHPHIQKLIKTWMVNNPNWIAIDPDSPEFIPCDVSPREYYLRPQFEGDPFFNELITTGCVSDTIETVIEYTEQRQNA